MRKLLLLALLTLPAFSADWDGYRVRRLITVNSGQITGTLTNWTAFYSSMWTDLPTSTNTPVACSCAAAISVPPDFIITDTTGTKVAGWEFERYNAGNGEFALHFFAASIANGSQFYAAYGKLSVTTIQTTPSSAWASSYKAVYHQGSPTTISTADSTVGANNLTNTGSMPAARGIAWGGGSGNGSSTYMRIASAPVSAYPLTISVWMNTNSGGGVVTGTHNSASAQYNGFHIFYGTGQVTVAQVTVTCPVP